MFSAVYITDGKSLLFEYLAEDSAPPYSAVAPIIAAKTVSHAKVPYQSVETAANYVICSRGSSHIALYVLCLRRAGEAPLNPLAPYAFLDKLAETMGVYFGTPLAPTKVLANTDTLYVLLYEMLANGMPHVTDFNNLKDVVLLSTLLLKILNTGNQLASAATNKSLASLSQMPQLQNAPKTPAVPWRRTHVKYTNNEMFVDVIEKVNVILRPKRTAGRVNTNNFDSAFYSTAPLAPTTRLAPVSGSISGQIDFLSHISGVPELLIQLNSAASYLEAPQFHRCIDIPTWSLARTLSFIPPDGRSTLMTYFVDLDPLPAKTQASMMGLLQFDCQQGLGVHENEFELRIFSLKHQLVPKFEKIEVQIFGYEPAASAEDSDADDDESAAKLANGITSMRAIRVSEGDFRYKGEGIGEWLISNLSAGSQPVLRVATVGSAALDAAADEQSVSSEPLVQMSEKAAPPPAPQWFKVKFIYKGQVPSGLQVSSVNLVASTGLGSTVKPYKGVKYTTESGEYTIRAK